MQRALNKKQPKKKPQIGILDFLPTDDVILKAQNPELDVTSQSLFNRANG
jgi:hypothetical protein